MTRSLFQKPRGTGFPARHFRFDDGDVWLPPRQDVEFEQRRQSRSLFWRLPLIAKIIVILMAAAAALLVGSITWLVIGALMQ